MPGHVGVERELGQLADAIARGDGPTEVVDAIRRGGDPLGAAFCRLRSPADRRPAGATYTPRAVVDAMVSRACSLKPSPAHIIDPGAGSGRFSLAAAAAFPRARIIAVEIDPLAARVLRANVAAAGIAERVEVVEGSFLNVVLPKIEGRALFIGNPPYVRHHRIDGAEKAFYVARMERFGVRASQLAGLYLHFLAKTAELARNGDAVCFITAGEWMDVNYGSAARELLVGPLGLARLDILEPTTAVFDDAMTSAVVLSCAVGGSPRAVKIRRHAVLGDLELRGGRMVSPVRLRCLDRWSQLGRARRIAAIGARLGDFFKVKRGQVSGANIIWIANSHSPAVPEQFLRPTITGAREIIAAGEVLSDARHLRRVIDLPADLQALEGQEQRQVENFIRWAKAARAHEGYIARHRSPWWAIRLYEPAPVVVTYMGRRPPVFVRNKAGARLLNIAHGLYPRVEMDDELLMGFVRWLRANVSIDAGRAYAGGLIKFEPKELERLIVPPLERLRDEASPAANLEPRPTGDRGRPSAGGFPA